MDKFKASLEWIKGHQDRTTAFQDLPLRAQANVIADGLAGEAMDTLGYCRPVIPLMPTRPVSLELNGRSIHRNYKAAIRDAAHSDALRHYITDRQGWSATIFDSVDWECHRRALNNQFPHRVHLIKLCHGLLPVGRRVHKYDLKYPHCCPTCGSAQEDFLHVLRCPHPSRSVWRSKFFDQLRTCVTQIDYDPSLATILLHGLRAWFDGHIISSSPYHPRYSSLITQQAAIGWDQLFLGRLSARWGVLQDAFRLSRPPPPALAPATAPQPGTGPQPRQKDGLDWTTAIIGRIWTSWHILWKARNGARHGIDEASRAQARHDATIRELSLLYALQPSTLHKDSHLFDKPLSARTKDTTHYTRQWINTFGPVIRKSVSDALKFDLRNVKPISSYFSSSAKEAMLPTHSE